MLKDNGKSKPKKRFGRYIICDNCKEKIYIDSDEVKEETTKIANKKIYQCFCGNDIVID